MLNSRNLMILQSLIKSSSKISIKELAELNNISQRAIRYDIDNINEYLEMKNLSKIEKLSKGYLLLENTDEIERYLHKNYNQYLLTPEDRVNYMLLEILFNGYINLSKLSEDLDISRSTVKTDLKAVKEMLKEYNLELNLKHKIGLVLSGEEESIRKIKLRFIMKYLRKYERYKKVDTKSSLEDIFIVELLDRYLKDIDIESIKTFINYIQKLMNKIISDEAYEIILSYLMIMIYRIRRGEFLEKVQNKNFLMGTQEYSRINRGIGILEANARINLSEEEILKITDYFLGSHTYNFNYSYYENWVEVEILVKNLIEKFNEKIEVDISKDSVLLDGLINHIKPTLYRIKNKLELQNSIYEEVFDSYPNLFNITSKVVEELEHYIEEKFSRDEIAFLVIHFKAAIDRNKHRIKDIKKVLLVCGLGYGSSKLLAQQIKEVYSIDIVDIIPYHLLDKYSNESEVDLIITTLSISREREESLKTPIVKVKPILGKDDIHILDKYDLPKYRKKILLSEVLGIIEKHTDVRNRQELLEGLEELMEDRVINDLNEREMDITDLLELENIKIGIEVESVEEAIQEAGNLLVAGGYVREEYTREMIDIINEFGSYIVVAPGIAMPHARGGESVVRSGMSLVTLKKPVKFRDGKETDVIIAFSSLDGKEHLNSLVDIMNLITDYDLRESLNKVRNPKEALKLIYRYKLD